MPDEEEDQYGKHFGKLDIDRVGFFDNTPPGPFDLYETKIIKGEVREDLDKLKRLYCNQKNGLFEDELKRIFVGEVLPELGRQPKSKKKKTQLGIIRPGGTPKQHSTPGDWYGCIGKQPQAFSPLLKLLPEATEKREKELPNCITNPNPLGGPGYLKITINPYLPIYDGYEPYELEVERQERQDNKKPRRFVNICFPQPYFDENPYAPLEEEGQDLVTKNIKISQQPKRKKRYFYLAFPRAPKGKTSGCFHKFPSYSSDPYDKKRPRQKAQGLPKIFCSTPITKSKFTTSIIDKVTNISLNANNFAQYTEKVYPLNRGQ